MSTWDYQFHSSKHWMSSILLELKAHIKEDGLYSELSAVFKKFLTAILHALTSSQ